MKMFYKGGMALMLIGPLVQKFNAAESGKDETGLGRWVMITLSGSNGFTTCIVCGYNPCGNSRLNTGMVYAQGKQLVVCLDENEDINKKSLDKILMDTEGLAMKEVVGTYTRKKIGPTFFWGSKPIDGILATSNITMASAYYGGLWDRRP